MKIALILILLILSAAVLLKLRKPASKRPASAKRKIPKKPGTPGAVTPLGADHHRSVSITVTAQACEAALGVAGKRFLVGELAGLPLDGCDAPRCDCKFVHHDDRRSSNEDKRALSGLSTELYAQSGKPERRDKKGRRKRDQG